MPNSEYGDDDRGNVSFAPLGAVVARQSVILYDKHNLKSLLHLRFTIERSGYR